MQKLNSSLCDITIRLIPEFGIDPTLFFKLTMLLVISIIVLIISWVPAPGPLLSFMAGNRREKKREKEIIILIIKKSLSVKL